MNPPGPVQGNHPAVNLWLPVRLRQDALYNVPMHVCQTVVTATVAIGESFVVDAHQVQDGGVEIVDVDRFLDRPDAVFVRGAVDITAFHAGTGQPGREGPVVMLAARGIGRIVERRAAELCGPDDEHVVQHTSLLQILEQACDWLIHLRSQSSVVRHIAVRIPVGAGAGMDEFDKPHAAFDQTSGRQTLPSETVGVSRVIPYSPSVSSVSSAIFRAAGISVCMP